MNIFLSRCDRNLVEIISTHIPATSCGRRNRTHPGSPWHDTRVVGAEAFHASRLIVPSFPPASTTAMTVEEGIGYANALIRTMHGRFFENLNVLSLTAQETLFFKNKFPLVPSYASWAKYSFKKRKKTLMTMEVSKEIRRNQETAVW